MDTIKKEEELCNYPDLEKMCRLCLKEDAGTISIFETQPSLVLRIMTCTAIEVQTDSLSKLICESCRIDLERSYYFRKKTQSCNNKLKKHLRLINAGKKSTVFDKNSENDDDEYELEDSLLFLNKLEGTQKEKIENEIEERVNLITKQKQEEYSKLENQLKEEKEKKMKQVKLLKEKYERIMNQRIAKIKNEHKEELKRLKDEYDHVLNIKLEKNKMNLQEELTTQILSDIKDFLYSKQNFNKRPRILNLEASSNDDAENVSKKQKVNTTSPVAQRKSESHSGNITSNSSNKKRSSRVMNSSSTTSNNVEFFKIESEPPEKLLKYYDENNENNYDDITLCEGDSVEDDVKQYNDNVDIIIDNEQPNNTNEYDDIENDEQNQSTNFEILDFNEETVSSECDEGKHYFHDSEEAETNVKEEIEKIKSVEVDCIKFNDFPKVTSSTEVEEFEDGGEEDQEEDDDNKDDDDENDEYNDKNELKKSNTSHTQKAHLKQENDDIGNLSDKITQVKVKSQGKVIIMEVQTQETRNENCHDYNKNKGVNEIINDSYATARPTANNDAVRIFRCKFCPVSFSRESLLIRHGSVHEKSRSYSCECCDKWFACRSSLNRHRRTHTGEKPYKCEECGRDFIQKEILKRHVLTHTGERPYKCQYCDKSFVQKSHLRQHINQKHTENPVREMHVCHLCPKVFMHASGLSRHLITHTGYSYNCMACSKSFSDRSALKRHIIGVHEKKPEKSDENTN